MALTTQLERTDSLQAEKIAREHNAMIKERYRRLQDAEAEQFAQATEDLAAQQTPRASILAPEMPVYTNAPTLEQTPTITEFVRPQAETATYATENYSFAERTESVLAPTPTTAVQAPTMQVNVYAPTQAAVETQTQYRFSTVAKRLCMAVAATVVGMLCVMGINSGIIRKNTARLRNLEAQEQALAERNEELTQRIAEVKELSEETLAEIAAEKNWIKIDG